MALDDIQKKFRKEFRVVRESSVERKFVVGVKDQGCMTIKLNGSGFRGKTDRLLIGPYGIIWFIELKRPGKTRSALQKSFKKHTDRLGHRNIKLDSNEEVEEFLIVLAEQIKSHSK